jgi:SAM-dependent methyltransferase
MTERRWSTSADAFGHALIDYLHGKGRGFEIIERDDGFIELSGGRTIYLAEYPDWPLHHRRAMRYVRGRVLDIGCGAGRHALYLQRRGFSVVGIDVSPLTIHASKLRGLRNAKVLSITQLDARLGKFDTLLMLGANFGLVGTPKRARWLLGRFRTITTPGARIIAESLDPYQTTNSFHRAYHRRNRRRGRMAGQLRLRVRYQKYASPWFDYLFASQQEMQRILQGTGWSVRQFIRSGGPTYIAVIQAAR